MIKTLDPKAPLKPTDRCDKCGALARVRATLTNGELYFCGHHARDLGYTLVSKSIEVYDPESMIEYGR